MRQQVSAPRILVAATLLLTMVFLLNWTALAAAEETVPADDAIKIVVNSKTLDLPIAPAARCNRVMVPARAVAEALGAKVIWQESKQSILIQNDDKTILMTMYHPIAYVNGEIAVLDVPPFSIDGSTLIPLYFITDNLNAKASWSAATNTVTITSEPKAVAAYSLQ